VRGARIHLCAHCPCSSLYDASKYGLLPPPTHGTFLQGHSPDDLSSLQPALVVAGYDGSAMETAPSLAEHPISSVDHAPSVVGAPAESPAVSAELIVPSTIEQPPTVVKPPLTNGKVSVGVAPTTPSAAECLDAQAGSPNGHNKAMEFPQPAGWQIGGP
jgi:hypothetical protein